MKNIKLLGVIVFISLLLPNFSKAQDLTNGLISVWEFDETSDNTAKDELGKIDGTLKNGVLTNQSGVINQALYLDGINDYVDLTNNSELSSDNMTYSIWFKSIGIANPSSYKGLLFKASDTGVDREIAIIYDKTNSGYINVSAFGGIGNLGINHNIENDYYDNKWHSCIVVKKNNQVGDSILVFIDGAKIYNMLSNYKVNQNQSHLEIGRLSSSSPTSGYFSGWIDQTAIWNRALTAAEVAQLYNSGQGLAYTNWGGTTQALDGGSITPSSLAINYGENPGTISNSLSASGGTGSFIYQWQKSTDSGSSWVDISGATSTSFASPALTQTTWYRRKVTSGIESAYSNVSQITVNIITLSGGSVIPASNTVNSGKTTTISNSVLASGGTGTYSYQWEYSINNGVSWTIISGATGTSYTSSALTQTIWYRRKVTSGSNVAYSNESHIAVNTVALDGGTISPSEITINAGESPGTISNATVASGGSGNYIYQWQDYKLTVGLWYDISGATSSSYTSPTLTESTLFRRKVTSGTDVAYSNLATITVNAAGGTTGEVQNLTLDSDGQTLRLTNSAETVVLPWKKLSDRVSTSQPVYIGDAGSGLSDKMFVNGRIKANEITVENTSWSDFVFDPEYNLKSLNEVECFIKANKHLPDVPSEKSIYENGVRLGEMNAILLQKIEELTLYILEQEKSIQEQNKRIEKLEKLNSK